MLHKLERFIPRPLGGPYMTIMVIAAFWGTSFMFVKTAAASGLSPLAIAAARGLLAGAVLGGWLLLRRPPARDAVYGTGRLIRDAGVLALFNGIAPNVLVALALQRIDSAPAAMIQASVPLIVMAIGLLPCRPAAARESPGRMQGLGLVIGFVGVFAIVGPLTVLGGSATLAGTLAMLGAAASYAVVTVYLRHARPVDIVRVGFWQQLASGAVALLLAAAMDPMAIGWPSAGTWPVLIGLAVLATVVPMLMVFQLLRTVPAAQASLVQYLLPLAATVYGVVLLGESPRLDALIGGALVLAGVFIASRRPASTARGTR